MELPLFPLRIRRLEVPIRFSRADTARVSHRTGFLGLRHSTPCCKSSFVASRLAIASYRSSVIHFSVFGRAPSVPPTNCLTLRCKGENPGPLSVSSRDRSDAAIINRKKDRATARVNERIRHNSSRKEDAGASHRQPLRKNISSGTHSNEVKLARKGGPKAVDFTESVGNPISVKERRSRKVWSGEYEAIFDVGQSSSDDGTAISASWKETNSSKEIFLDSSNSKCVKTSSSRPILARALNTGLPRRHRKPLVFSQAQIEEEKERKREESKERIAMAEANGFRLSKRAKKNPEEVQHVLKLNLCSKHGDLHGALEVYDTVKKGELFNLKLHHYNVLLYICSGAASGSIIKGRSGKEERALASVTSDTDRQLAKNSDESREESSKSEPEKMTDVDVVSFSPEDMQLAARRGTEIYEDMLQAKVPPNEATFTAVARLAVAKGDGDLAFETVKKMAAAGITPKLRSYGPPLLCFCEHNQVEKAFEVDDHMAAAGVLPDEILLEALLRLSIAAGLETKVYTLLQRLRKIVRDVSPATAITIEKWFNCEAAVSATYCERDRPPSKEDIREAAESRGGGWHGLGWLGKGKWVTKRTNVNKAGVCQSCGETLCAIDLDPEETEKFARSVAELAMQREHNANEFVTFQEWLEKNGPFEAILDGANIGMYNSALRGFNYNQVDTVASAVKARSLVEKPPLIILHCRRTSDGVSRSPRSQNIIESWTNENILYSTPHGSNDDWYWLYAAVKCKCLLVTNDEMRDHLFELLGNNFFPKWKERHQVRFTFSANGLDLLMPPPYSTVIQESQAGSWHMPLSGGGDDEESPREWLCVIRPSMDSLELRPSESKSDVLMVPNKDVTNEPRSDVNLISPSKEVTEEFVFKANEVEPCAPSECSETLSKLEAAEKLSISAISYEI